jgi:hypothetical protein
MMRAALNKATAFYTLGGLAKKYPPKKITLPKLKCLEDRPHDR